MSDQADTQQPIMPPQQVMPYMQIGGKEFIELLETTSGRSILEEDEQWYSKSRLLPLANMDERQQKFIIWLGFSECWSIMRSIDPYSERQLSQISEYMMSLVGQSSRALYGAERMRMSTTTFAFQQSGPVQKPRKGGLLGFLSGNW